jgi:hypothetical protein
MIAGDESEWERRSQCRRSREEEASILIKSATEGKGVLLTHCLASLHQTGPTRSDGEGPDGASTGIARTLLPYLLTRSVSRELVTELTPLGPNELPHLPLSEARERFGGIGVMRIAGRGPQSFRL